MTSLFDPIKIGDIELANRIVMAPLTRNRSPGAVPNTLNVTYYEQRASAGLLITEATAITHQGQGYADVPGLYTKEALDGWKQVTAAVHKAGGKIVVQMWHVGRISHTSLQPNDGAPVAPSSAVKGLSRTRMKIVARMVVVDLVALSTQLHFAGSAGFAASTPPP